jgi:hypothetical protein
MRTGNDFIFLLAGCTAEMVGSGVAAPPSRHLTVERGEKSLDFRRRREGDFGRMKKRRKGMAVALCSG